MHGPLLALLSLEIPRRYSQRPVASFQYRLSHPVFCGATVLTHGRRNGADTFALSAMADGGPAALTGAAVFS